MDVSFRSLGMMIGKKGWYMEKWLLGNSLSQQPASIYLFIFYFHMKVKEMSELGLEIKLQWQQLVNCLHNIYQKL